MASSVFVWPGLFYNNGAIVVFSLPVSATSFEAASTGSFSFSSTTDPTATADTFLLRGASNTLDLRNGTTAQTSNVYRTYTDGSNYNRVKISGDIGSSQAGILLDSAGTGVAAANFVIGTQDNTQLFFRTNGTNNWGISSGNISDLGSHTVTVGSTIAAGGLTPAGTLGTPVTVGYGDVSAATNTGTASIATYTLGAADATFRVSANCLVTTSTTHSFSLDCTYTDEGNTARTLVIPVAQLAGTFLTSGLITNVTGAGPYESATMTIRAKASTVITIRTSAGGTFTTVVYNARGVITRVS